MDVIKFGLLFCMLVCLGNCLGIAGGRKKLSLDDPEEYKKIRNYANFAVETITNARRLERENDKLNFKLIRIVEAESQLVAGMNYFIKFRMRDAYCKYISDCSVELCKVKIFRSLTNETALSDHSCELQRTREVNLVGGRNDAPINSKEVQDAAKFAVKDLNMNSDKDNYFKLIEIKSAQSQVVAGYNYFIKASFGETGCKKSNGLENVENCELLGGKDKVECEVTVYLRPWGVQTYKITRSNCVF